MTATPARTPVPATRAQVAVRWLATTGAWIGGIATLAMASATLVDVVGRSFFGFSFRGVYELTQILLVPAVFFGMAEATRRNAHIVVDLIDLLKLPSVTAVLRRAGEFATLGVLALLFWMGLGEAREALRFGDVSPDLRLSVIWLWAPLLTGLALGAFAVLARLLSGWRS